MPPMKIVNKNITARLVTSNIAPCAFCFRAIDDELLYGKLYAIGDIQCHYYCVLLSSCLIQRGKDRQGLFGFLYEDIIAEIERCKKHKCSYCRHFGANMGCSVTQCRKQFHLPCGKEKNSVSLFFGNYKTYCQNHAPKQQIPQAIMVKAKLRKSRDNKVKKINNTNFKDLKELSLNDSKDLESDTQSVCVICYENVEGYPIVNTFWPPCCGRDAWFHRSCLERMALSAGIHHLKCPLCNDKENFYKAVVSQGYYVPDRDAAWELEQNAFAEIYERSVSCSAADCKCPMGQYHDADNGEWSISMCLLCGSMGQHVGCLPATTAAHLYICVVCKPAAPEDLGSLANSIEVVISQEQTAHRPVSRRGPVMPSRMSLRSSKNPNRQMSSCSRQQDIAKISTEYSENVSTSREILNLKPPKRPLIDNIKSLKPRTVQISPMKKFTYDSPTKILEEAFRKKFGTDEMSIKDDIINELRTKFKKPRPFSVKKQIINYLLDTLFENVMMEVKQKEPIKVWCSPKKLNENEENIVQIPQEYPIINLSTNPDQDEPMNPEMFDDEIQEDIYPVLVTPNKLKTVDIETNSSLEISAKDEIVNIDVIKLENNLEPLNVPSVNNMCSFKFSSSNKEVLEDENVDIDLEKFKNQYLYEVSGKMLKQNCDTPSRKRKIDRKGVILQYDSEKQEPKHRSIYIKNKNIKVKIKWKKEKLKLHINNMNNEHSGISKNHKQYILKYSPKKNYETVKKYCTIMKPDLDVTPIKRKYVKQTNKSPDNLVQTSIHKFFQIKSPNTE